MFLDAHYTCRADKKNRYLDPLGGGSGNTPCPGVRVVVGWCPTTKLIPGHGALPRHNREASAQGTTRANYWLHCDTDYWLLTSTIDILWQHLVDGFWLSGNNDSFLSFSASRLTKNDFVLTWLPHSTTSTLASLDLTALSAFYSTRTYLQQYQEASKPSSQPCLVCYGANCSRSLQKLKWKTTRSQLLGLISNEPQNVWACR
jgi:hypothetical protein